MVTYSLDAWAVIEYLQGSEPAARRVEAALADRSTLMSWINLGEVVYKLRPRLGPRRTDDVVARLRRSLRLDVPSPRRVLEAATIKSEHRLSYADAFAVATALAHEAVLLTGDPEILDADAEWQVEDLRAT